MEKPSNAGQQDSCQEVLQNTCTEVDAILDPFETDLRNLLEIWVQRIVGTDDGPFSC